MVSEEKDLSPPPTISPHINNINKDENTAGYQALEEPFSIMTTDADKEQAEAIQKIKDELTATRSYTSTIRYSLDCHRRRERSSERQLDRLTRPESP